jgi:HK97 gp10 family phage protein
MMPGEPHFKVRIEGIEELDQEFKRQLRKCEAIKKVIAKEAIAIQSQAKENLRELHAIDTGHLRQSITIDSVAGGFGAEIGPEAPYGLFVEMGTRAHFPPAEPLEEWAHRHGMEDGAGYAIAKKISTKPTPARPFLFPALFSRIDNIMKHLRELLKR